MNAIALDAYTAGIAVSLRRPSPYLIKGGASVSSGPQLKTGTLIPETGIYKVIHSQHRLPHEVILFENEQFPRCSKCGEQVAFELVYPAKEVYADSSFRVVLHELPTIDENPGADAPPAPDGTAA